MHLYFIHADVARSDVAYLQLGADTITLIRYICNETNEYFPQATGWSSAHLYPLNINSLCSAKLAVYFYFG